jgi:serine/threonine-protein kinase
MGEVYRARDTTLGRAVAVKLLPADAAQDQRRLRRFEQEAHAASGLNHPNILTIYEVGVHNGTPFVASELVEGENLRRRMARGRPGVREVLDIGAQIASALAATHAAGIVHRDVKPENIMVRNDGIVKVLDFGIAKIVRTTEGEEPPTIGASDTQPGMVLGTFQYMSPEQARGLETDPRTDIWSLGVVLYELVTGRSAFAGATTSDVIAAILGAEPKPVSMHMRDAPAELERIVMKALQKDREERYQDIKDLALDLKSLKRRLDLDVELSRHSETPSGSNTGRSRPARKRVAFVVGASMATLALGYAAYSGFLAGPAGDNVDSVAVLPFTNESGDPNHEYLSDGISETLINNLSGLSDIKVIARSSSFEYKGKTVDLQEVARALGVKAIVTGRVAQRGDNLVIGVELVDTADRTQMWGEQYNRKATDLLQVQADISDDVAEKLRRRLSTAERDRLTRSETTNPQAYELALQGRFYARQGGFQNTQRAIEYFQQAIALDPNYALAYVGLSNNYRGLVANSLLDPKEYMPKVEAAVRKALELDETLADAHAALANFLRETWDWTGAEREYQRAIALNPSLAGAHRGYAAFLNDMGRHDEALGEVTRARELDPLNPFAGTQVGFRLFFARRYDEAIETLKRELDRGVSLTAVVLGYTYDAKGMYSDAIAAYRLAIERGDNGSSTQIFLAAAYAHAGDRQQAQAILKRLETGKAYVSPGELAVLYAALGEREQAFTSLEKAFAARDLQLQYLGADPSFDSLRSDPRFEDLLRRVGLPQARRGSVGQRERHRELFTTSPLVTFRINRSSDVTSFASRSTGTSDRRNGSSSSRSRNNSPVSESQRSATTGGCAGFCIHVVIVRLV